MAFDILIFSAHPDDCEFGMGGTLLKLAGKYKVVNVVLTRGEAGTYGTPSQREREAKEAGKHGGYDVEQLRFADNNIEYSAAFARELAFIIRKHKPKAVFVPYHTNNYQHTDGAAHPDHTELGKTVRAATRFAKFKNAEVEGTAHNVHKLIYYMVPRYKKPSFVVDIGDVVSMLPEFWECHKSQTQLRDGAIIDYLMNSRKHIGMLNNKEYAESFIVEEPLSLDIEDFFKI
jgi:N-acetylglucosamine malate deacetylase 1